MPAAPQHQIYKAGRLLPRQVGNKFELTEIEYCTIKETIETQKIRNFKQNLRNSVRDVPVWLAVAAAAIAATEGRGDHR